MATLIERLNGLAARTAQPAFTAAATGALAGAPGTRPLATTQVGAPSVVSPDLPAPVLEPAASASYFTAPDGSDTFISPTTTGRAENFVIPDEAAVNAAPLAPAPQSRGFVVPTPQQAIERQQAANPITSRGRDIYAGSLLAPTAPTIGSRDTGLIMKYQSGGRLTDEEWNRLGQLATRDARWERNYSDSNAGVGTIVDPTTGLADPRSITAMLTGQDRAVDRFNIERAEAQAQARDLNFELGLPADATAADRSRAAAIQTATNTTAAQAVALGLSPDATVEEIAQARRESSLADETFVADAQFRREANDLGVALVDAEGNPRATSEVREEMARRAGEIEGAQLAARDQATRFRGVDNTVEARGGVVLQSLNLFQNARDRVDQDLSALMGVDRDAFVQTMTPEILEARLNMVEGELGIDRAAIDNSVRKFRELLRDQGDAAGLVGETPTPPSFDELMDKVPLARVVFGQEIAARQEQAQDDPRVRELANLRSQINRNQEAYVQGLLNAGYSGEVAYAYNVLSGGGAEGEATTSAALPTVGGGPSGVAGFVDQVGQGEGGSGAEPDTRNAQELTQDTREPWERDLLRVQQRWSDVPRPDRTFVNNLVRQINQFDRQIDTLSRPRQESSDQRLARLDRVDQLNANRRQRVEWLEDKLQELQEVQTAALRAQPRVVVSREEPSPLRFDLP